MSKAAPITFHDARLMLNGDGTIFWPDESLLIVSDLHLEKGAALSTGAPLPHYDTIDTLQRLQDRLLSAAAKRLVCLGDSFHTTERAFLLPPDHLQFLHQISRQSDIYWVTGNHDAQLPERLPGRIINELDIKGIRLCHETDGADLPTISGHYHPKARVQLRARYLSARCFIESPTDIIMPAFGSYTGGLNIHHEALIPFLQKQTRIHLIHDKNCYTVPYQKQLFKNM